MSQGVMPVSTKVQAMPSSLIVVPASRWPTRLPESTIRTASALPIPIAEYAGAAHGDRVSIVLITFNGLPYTKMCLSSLLGNGWRAGDELIVVDNASTDGTREYLRDLAGRNPFVRLELNERNLGFAAANNQGLALAAGRFFVLLNNDTIVPDGWRDRLVRWLDDDRIGMIGPVTNRACNEAQIDVPYRTYCELAEFAEEYMHHHAGQAGEIGMLAMFCVAIRRDVFLQVGELDERFELGMFEDDDYAQRVRRAGYRLVCAEDVFVHHFGQVSLGELRATGEYGRVFETNRRRFERKWRMVWHPHAHRVSPEYQRLRRRIRDVVAETVPAERIVMVIAKGDSELLQLAGRSARHFPQTSDGRFDNDYPPDGAGAIACLESGRAEGASFLVIPKPAFWWLEYYADFKRHLEQEYAVVVRDDETCLIFDLTKRHGRD